MDKSKRYKIIDVIKHGKKQELDKHIGIYGKFIRLTKGMRFEFLYEHEYNCLHSSKVMDIQEYGDVLTIQTLNTIYVFKMIGD